MGKNDKKKKGGFFGKKEEPEAEEPVTLTEAEKVEIAERVEEAKDEAKLLAVDGVEPVQETPPPQKDPEPAPTRTYVMSFNHDRMRQQCGKCGGTQLLITKTLRNEKDVKVGFEFTCNDCKQTYVGK